jgi:hypothetical protein
VINERERALCAICMRVIRWARELYADCCQLPVSRTRAASEISAWVTTERDARKHQRPYPRYRKPRGPCWPCRLCRLYRPCTPRRPRRPRRPYVVRTVGRVGRVSYVVPCRQCRPPMGRALGADRVSCVGRVGVSTARVRARAHPDGGTEHERIHGGT